jgi:mono/diheme cytochrome c family protein
MRPRRTFFTLAALTLVLIGGTSPLKAAAAAEPVGLTGAALYRQECSACHVAFPARSLPVASWLRLMSQLPHHFGSDASLDPASTRQLSTWLQANAATGSRAQAAPADDRITRSAWFLREHDEISSATWKRPAIGKASNCAACHRGAAEGRFSESDIQIPR